jgi:hypothetical protein
MGCGFNAKRLGKRRDFDKDKLEIFHGFERKTCSLLLRITGVIWRLRKIIEKSLRVENFGLVENCRRFERDFMDKLQRVTEILDQIQNLDRRKVGKVEGFVRFVGRYLEQLEIWVFSNCECIKGSIYKVDSAGLHENNEKINIPNY